MKRNILLPTDFSECSRGAIGYAFEFFKGHDCTFFLFHTSYLETSTMINLTNKLTSIVDQQAEENMDKLFKELEPVASTSRFDLKVILRKDYILEALERVVKKNDIDLVVMATKGATRAKRILFGSNTVKALRSVKQCPLLVVPDEYSYKPIDQIAFVSDYNRFYGVQELRPIGELLKLYNAKLKIMHINEEKSLSDIQEYNIGELKDYFKEFQHEFHWMPEYAKKTDEIGTFISSHSIDILAMVRYSHSLIETIFNEPVIKNISFDPKIPFLVIPEQVEKGN